MPTVHRLKHSFTAGELSPLMNDRVDFERYKNGCEQLVNAICATQGPAVRRPGTKFIYDLTSLGLDTANPEVRQISFIFNEIQAYDLVFFRHTDGTARLVFGYRDGLIVYDDPPITECPPGTSVSETAGEVVMLTLPSAWDIENFDWAQSADEMYIAQSGLLPHIIKRWGHYCWELTEITFTDQPSEWNSTDGYPERVTFHQQRLVFAANLTRRQTVWTSQAGDFSNFGVSSPLLDSDAITFTLDSGTQNKIVWITSGKSLHIGTIGNEWTVQGSTQTALTPTNILAQRQTNNGSEANKPLLVGLTTLFVERHGRTVNEFVYDYTYDSYKTSDMAILSPHLTENYSIIDWAYQQTPDSIIWCVREDGRIIAITYQRQHKVVGWHQHTTQGNYKSVACIPGETREDDVWFIVQREVDGEDKYYLEKLDDMFKSDSPLDARFLDSYAVYSGAATSELTRLDHLEGLDVAILANGAVHPNRTVIDGSITLNNSYTDVVVGLSYTTIIKPNLVDVPGNNGTILGRYQRYVQLYIDFYKTIGCKVGISDIFEGDREEEVPFRRVSDMTGEQIPLFSGWILYDLPESVGRNTRYYIKQDLPLPMTVRGIVDSVEVGDI